MLLASGLEADLAEERLRVDAMLFQQVGVLFVVDRVRQFLRCLGRLVVLPAFLEQVEDFVLGDLHEVPPSLTCQLSSLRVSRGSRNGSTSSGWPASICRPRSSSALNSAPSRMAMLESHSQTKKMITPPMAP